MICIENIWICLKQWSKKHAKTPWENKSEGKWQSYPNITIDEYDLMLHKAKLLNGMDIWIFLNMEDPLYIIQSAQCAKFESCWMKIFTYFNQSKNYSFISRNFFSAFLS